MIAGATGLSFLTPAAALLALVGLAPLAVLAVVERRARRARHVLGLGEPRLRARLPLPLALAACAALLGLAAAQPVVRSVETRFVRTDAEAFFVLDTSRSMLAAEGPGAPTRLDEAREAARRLRVAIPDVPVGVASFTDRVLPHLFPTASEEAFDATLSRAVGIERPPPLASEIQASTLFALADMGRQAFFSESARRRLLVVLTDGESRPFDAEAVARNLAVGPGIDLVVIQTWSPEERIYRRSGSVEAGYRPDPASADTVARLVEATGARSFSQGEIAAAAAIERELVGDGPRRARDRELSIVSLAPYAVLAALVPLGFLLWRRNLG